MLEDWKQIQTQMGATPQSLTNLGGMMRDALGVLAPEKTEALRRAAGFAMQPVGLERLAVHQVELVSQKLQADSGARRHAHVGLVTHADLPNVSQASKPAPRPLLTHRAPTLRRDMWDALDITEEEAAGLAEIARHDLELARDFARRALEATDNDEANRLARSYQRAARSYRQTLAVKARLKCDLAAAARVQSDIPKPRPGGAAVARRIGELRTALLRLSWDEAEPVETDGEAGDLAAAYEEFACRREDVELLISQACLRPDLGAAPLDDDVARLALEMGYSPETIARWRDLPDPPQAALDTVVEELAWESSA